ncbi:hypothetical protein H4J46_00190 [Colwellia sp. MB02u-6]|uniref:hypothetical protein n=1 Tax=Colwellia sp. MB02u-6 TaxID=2759824 RepID=UPI0015F5BA11|nr:hypothetical protein [Colwellia sp. MB02u-6]MBA6326390.1 hypothetical protein [Colwellia sp. MB02u-6]
MSLKNVGATSVAFIGRTPTNTHVLYLLCTKANKFAPTGSHNQECRKKRRGDFSRLYWPNNWPTPIFYICFVPRRINSPLQKALTNTYLIGE